MKYDVIVVGARCAGSSLAMLLARAGTRVLLVDRTTFPSDTLNGHYIHPAGVRSLERWGLLDRVLSPGSARPVREVHMDFGSTAFTGHLGWPDGQPAFSIAPRRHRLDALLVDAAAEAGVEVRQSFYVADLLREGERVVGITGHGVDGQAVEERAEIVVGADGLRSIVATQVGAPAYEAIPAHTCIYYSHWADLTTSGLEICPRPGRYALTFPTDAGLTCVAVGWRHAEFGRVRTDVEAEFLSALERRPPTWPPACEPRGAWSRSAAQPTCPCTCACRSGRAGRSSATPAAASIPLQEKASPMLSATPACLADAIHTGLGGTRPLDETLSQYRRRRDAEVMPIYHYTAQRARLEPLALDQARLISALADNQAAADRFVGLTAGTTAFDDFFSPANIRGLVGQSADRAA